MLGAGNLPPEARSAGSLDLPESPKNSKPRLMKTVTITRFPLPEGVSLEALQQGFEEVAPAFAKTPGLISKAFLVSPDLRQAGGSYLWESEAYARDFSEHTLRGMIRHRFGSECQIEYFATPLIVEGSAGKVENSDNQ